MASEKLRQAKKGLTWAAEIEDRLDRAEARLGLTDLRPLQHRATALEDALAGLIRRQDEREGTLLPTRVVRLENDATSLEHRVFQLEADRQREKRLRYAQRYSGNPMLSIDYNEAERRVAAAMAKPARPAYVPTVSLAGILEMLDDDQLPADFTGGATTGWFRACGRLAESLQRMGVPAIEVARLLREPLTDAAIGRRR